MRTTLKPLLLAVAPLIVLAGCDDQLPEPADPGELNTSLRPGSLAMTPDDAYIYLTGSVISTTPTSFRLDYGPDAVTVEMDDWDPISEAVAINVGDHVTISGRVDDNLAASKTVEASSVHIHNLNTTLYASSADEENFVPDTTVVLDPRAVDVTGRVSSIDGRTFILGPGRGIRVDTSGMAANPLDDEGMPRIAAGDRVYVWGNLALAGAQSVLRADGVISLTPAGRRDGPTAQPNTNSNAAEGNEASVQPVNAT